MVWHRLHRGDRSFISLPNSALLQTLIPTDHARRLRVTLELSLIIGVWICPLIRQYRLSRKRLRQQRRKSSSPTSQADAAKVGCRQRYQRGALSARPEAAPGEGRRAKGRSSYTRIIFAAANSPQGEKPYPSSPTADAVSSTVPAACLRVGSSMPPSPQGHGGKARGASSRGAGQHGVTEQHHVHGFGPDHRGTGRRVRPDKRSLRACTAGAVADVERSTSRFCAPARQSATLRQRLPTSSLPES